MNPWLVVAAIYFGLVFATGIIGTICWDLHAWTKNRAYKAECKKEGVPVDPQLLWHSVSRETMYLAGTYPWAAVILSGVIAFGIGVLMGHLFFPQLVQGPGTT